ncbi:5-methylthioadenosine/S-adenosylhomocysteine deaminase [Marinitoga hydrogenitolerans DSM 16785]|uniref:5-methylthioadenosine/S-adenosylhomocysteine deaminase n=1 Tax=Marinitoga hydrogenitolerans (strain DSM 16785 / JCM 12826 / AT1271) TaxID=1122195 RepID=A0A1M5AK15_MARH1|nr:amidohydrolase [Marinitoga hydrogenitolerans]SHF30563.1 5-methylthioadenosine/S-adenosylhomocysteine deaminase [Marinitoga hydrogenitolerans DSM 16785]
MKKILKNAYVLMSADAVIKKLDILIDNGIIIEISENIDGENAEIINLENKLITPGFINTHTHLAMSLFRGIGDDLTLEDWLFKEMFPREDLLNDELTYYGSLISILEMLSKGVTTVVDMYLFMKGSAEAVKDTGIRAFLTRGLGYDNDDGWKRRIDETLYLFENYHNNYNIKIGFGPHAPYTCPMNKLEEIAELTKKYNTFSTIHLYESINEREMYTFEDLEKTGLFKNDVIAAHCVHVDEKDIKILARNEITVAHNPSSNLKLGNGIAPILKMLEHEVNITLGTDGAASNNTLNIWDEMRFAALLQKKNGPEKFKTEEALRMVWENGGYALNEKIGRLEENYFADLIVIDLDSLEFYPKDINRIKSHIVYSPINKVYATMVNGEWVYYDGEYPKLKGKEYFEKFHKLYFDIEKKFNSQKS